MKPELENLSAQQSLDIITTMIKQAQGNVQRNNFFFLLWGWVIAFANIGMFTLIQLNYPYPYAIWAVTIPAWIITIYKGYQLGKVKRASTHFDRISGTLWMCYGISIFILVAFGYKINYQLGPVILIISAIPTLVTGIILKFKPLMLGGASFWIFGITGFLVPMEIQFLVGAVALICGYLVPGYLLKNTKANDV